MNKVLLFLILLPKGLWRMLGADVAQLRAVLGAKLMLDDRRPMAMGKGQGAKKKPFKFMTALSVLISVVIGFMYIIPLMMTDKFMGLWLYFTVFLLMLSFMLISDFSTVLFDKRDNSILLPRPVNERTLLLSRLLHMFIYLFRIVFPMSLAGWVVLGYAKGWAAALWFPVMILQLTVIALFLVNACYLMILRFAKPGRFKDIINYFQIAFSVLFFACVYLMPRAMNNTDFQEMKHTDYAWAVYTPTYWLSAAWSWIETDKLSAATKWISILAIVGPLLLVWLIVKYLSPSFAKRIGNIDDERTEGKAEEGATIAVTAVAKKDKLYLKLAALLNKNPLSKAGFIIAWLQTNRSRNFKMRVYPTFAYVPVYFVYLISQSKKPLSEVWEGLPQSSTHILLLYMTSFIVLQLLSMLVYSDQYKASWVYYSSPIARPGDVMVGAFKGVWLKYFIPMFAVVSGFVFWVWGIGSLLDIALAFINITLLALSVLRIAYRRLPFSAMERMNEKGNRFFKTMFVMILPMGLGFGHYWTTITPWLWWMKLVFILLSSILLWLLWDSYKHTSWDEVKKVDLSS